MQERVSSQPYSILSRLSVALAYKHLGYPDLAIGDAYKALLLVDEVSEEGEFHDEALSAAEEDVALFQSSALAKTARLEFPSLKLDDIPAGDEEDEDEAVSYAKKSWSKIAYEFLPLLPTPDVDCDLSLADMPFWWNV